jgi:hypothetical protein
LTDLNLKEFFMASISDIYRAAQNLRPDYQDEPEFLRELAMQVVGLAEKYLKNPQGDSKDDFALATRGAISRFEQKRGFCVLEPLAGTLAKLIELCESKD